MNFLLIYIKNFAQGIMIYIGTSGYSYDFWLSKKGTLNYYRTNTNLLKTYSKEFNSVEINMTRYRKITPSICKNWLKEVPSDFMFTIKIPTYITHYKKLNDFEEWWDEFKENLDVLGKQCKALLFQFHTSFKFTKKNIEKLKNIQKIISTDHDIVFEFRDKEWYAKDKKIEKLFSKKNWIFAILHIPQNTKGFGNLSSGINRSPYSKNNLYHRFHGTDKYCFGVYDTSYFIKNIDLSKTTYAYFNNTDTWEFDLKSSNLENISIDMMPFKGTSYAIGILFHPIVPSAIHDARCMNRLAKEISKEYKIGKDGYVIIEFK